MGFEPTTPYGDTDFRDRLLKPLGHLCKIKSNTNILQHIGANVTNFFCFFKILIFFIINATIFPAKKADCLKPDALLFYTELYKRNGYIDSPPGGQNNLLYIENK